MDVHAESMHATVIGEDGQILEQRGLANEDIPKFLKSFKVEKVGMEASTQLNVMELATFHRQASLSAINGRCDLK